jgi:hypothetical protein
MPTRERELVSRRIRLTSSFAKDVEIPSSREICASVNSCETNAAIFVCRRDSESLRLQPRLCGCRDMADD